MKKLISGIMILSLLLIYGCSKDDKEDKSSEKQILTFSFAGISPVVNGVIDQVNKTITLTDVPYESGLTVLVPTITVSAGATVNPLSGVAANFTSPVIFTVTAEDGSTAQYTVTVTLGTETISGTMSSNRTLTNRFSGNTIDYIIDGEFRIDGNALLTIAPGVKIAFTTIDSKIIVGDNAGMKMVGTETEPIILTGPVNNTNTGAWYGVEYNSSRSDNLIQYVNISYAGSSDWYGALNINGGAKVSVKNTTITYSGNYGIYVTGTLSAFSGNVIKNCDNAPVYLEYFDNVPMIDAASDLMGNTNNFVEVGYGFSAEQSTEITIKNINVAWFIKGEETFTRKVTIAEGNTFLMDNYAFINVESTATLIAEGTSEMPIIFKHINDTPGGWNRIAIQSNLPNSLKYCTIANGGYDSWLNCNLEIASGAKVTLQNCTFKDTPGYGVILFDNSSITYTNATFSGCTSGNIYNEDQSTVSTSF